MKVLSIIPPLVQINTPYPSTSFLTGFLRSRGWEASQRDLGLALVLEIFTERGLEQVKDAIRAETESTGFFRAAFEDYQKTITPVVRFLQGKDPALAHRIAARTLLPEGPRFQTVEAEDLLWAFGTMGVQDQAKHLASLYIDDLTDVISQGVDPEFSLSRYGEKLAASQASFDALYAAMGSADASAGAASSHELPLIDRLLRDLTLRTLDEIQPDAVFLSTPFPGCVLGAFKIAKFAREWASRQKRSIHIALGGGYVNTELRELRDPRVFEFVDAVTLDDGERPAECLLEYWSGKRERAGLLRAFVLSERGRAIEWVSSKEEHDVPQVQAGIPTTEGLPVRDYLSLVEMLNPMHRYWSDLYWNKIMLAHGCYWHQCTFCDVSLDYIKRYEVSPVKLTVERMKALAAETGSSGFHFVDEAAPPVVLKELSRELVAQKLSYSWWGNIRFEKTFTREVTELMSDAGCVAVSGGLEVASDRLLKMMRKGVTVEQVARVSKNFRDAKVMVHAYLMYGFPTQTVQETVDSLERVRQLFEAGCLTSAFWHRFSATAHSPIGLAPEEFGIRIDSRSEVAFARNDLPFEDPTDVDHDALGRGLRKAVYNYMLGIGLEEDVRQWFDIPVPKTQVESNFIQKALKSS